MTHSRSVALALSRLRGGVWLCCWLITGALVVQAIVWGLTVFTDMRWSEVGAGELAPAPLVVTAAKQTPPRLRSALDGPVAAEKPVEPVNPNRILSPRNHLFAMISSMAGGFGSLAVIALLPLVGLGALLATGSATKGVEKTVSAFGWSLVLALVVLPVGELVGFAWQDGAFWSYERLTERVDAAAGSPVAVVFCARYLALPLASGCGVALIALRFSSGVEAGAYKGEQLKVDAELEAEAGNIKPTTLHGGRAASAMRSTMADPPKPGIASLATSSMKQPSAGEAPKRLI